LNISDFCAIVHTGAFSRIPGTPYQSGLLQIIYYIPGIPGVKKDHNGGCPFKNQDDNSTGKNACKANSALAVRLFDKHGMLVDNGFTQGTVFSKGVEVPR